jgi:hypothetical protein
MQFTTHPEIHEFRLDTGYRGALFAWPVLMNPSRVAIRNWSLDQLGFDRLGESLTDNRFMTHQGQGMTFLASAVDASFVSSARADESSVLRMLVSLQKSLPSVELARELFRINHFDVAGGGLVFIIGAIYRKASDPRPLFIPDAEEFLVSKERLSMETALGNGEPHSRHQILPAFPLSKAIAEGLRMGVQCWGGMHDEPLRCEFDLEPTGGVTFALSTEDRKAVYLRLGHDVISAQDMTVIQDAFLRCSANSAIHQSAYKH